MRLPLLLLLWMSSVAWARTVAVLPLAPGAKTQAYEGLGTALAGMLITDLSKVEGVAVVERSRLDALLTEAELVQKGFIDPKTAAQLGKGLGAQWVVTGTWSVIEPTFVVDLRVIEVSSGVVLGTGRGQGQVTDFVTVEKDAVEAMLASVKVDLSGAARRKILSQAPTESFDALKAYAAGLKAEQDADYEKARAHYEQAAKVDSSFDLARERAAGLRARIQATREQEQKARVDARTQAYQDALDKTPNPMSFKRPATKEQLAQLRIRWEMLELLDRPCQISREMMHTLRLNKGELDPDKGAYFRVFEQAYALGLMSEPPYRMSNGVPRYERNAITDVLTFTTPMYPYGYVVNITDGIDRAGGMSNGTSLANHAIGCAGTDSRARLDAILEVRALVEDLGLLDATTTDGGKSIRLELDLYELEARARLEGMTDRIARRLAAIVEQDYGDSGAGVRSDVNNIVTQAEATTSRLRLLDGMTMPQVVERIRGATTKSAPFDTSTAACAPIVGARPYRLQDPDKIEGPVTARNRYAVTQAIGQAQALRRLGCIQGVEGDLDTTAKALAWLDTFDRRLHDGEQREKCEKDLASLQQRMAYTRNPDPAVPERWAHMIVLEAYKTMVVTDCAGP